MIILSIALIYFVFISISSLMQTQDDRHRKQKEEQKRKDDMLNALKTYGTGKY